MTNLEKYNKTFKDALELELSQEELEKLEYQGIEAWDSIGHMSLISEIEDVFDISMDTDDIIDFSSYEVGKNILNKNYDIVFEE